MIHYDGSYLVKQICDQLNKLLSISCLKDARLIFNENPVKIKFSADGAQITRSTIFFKGQPQFCSGKRSRKVRGFPGGFWCIINHLRPSETDKSRS